MIVGLTRRAGFSAGHGYHLPNLSESENRELFGRHASEIGHGHNYTIEISVEGPIDRRTGVVVNIAEIDKALKERVVFLLADKFLNKQVPYFFDHAPTTENIVRFAHLQLSRGLPDPVGLTGIAVSESEFLRACWKARATEGGAYSDMSELTLTRKYDFSAAHRLHSDRLNPEENAALFGKCNHVHFHGHNYEIEISIAGVPDERSGMLYDLDRLDTIVGDSVIAPMDHRNLNLDIPEFAELNPTSEMLAVVIWNRLKARIPDTGSPRLSKVLVRETPRNEFEYCGR